MRMGPVVENKINEMIRNGSLKPIGSLFRADGFSTQENKMAQPVILINYRMNKSDIQEFLVHPQRLIDSRSLRCDVLNNGTIRNWSYRFLMLNWICVT
jgi:hypothetical protein